MRISKELQCGKAGEYLVCADLILKGFVAFPSEQGLPYDVLFDNGKRLFRIQVKTTFTPRIIPQRNKQTMAYIFNIKRHGANNQSIYDNSEVDIFALVCLDTRSIGYLLNGDMPTTINFRVDSLRGQYYDEKGIQDYKHIKELSETISNQSEIARQTGVHISQVNRILSKDFIPFKTNARYFSDIIRNPKWFESL